MTLPTHVSSRIDPHKLSSRSYMVGRANRGQLAAMLASMGVEAIAEPVKGNGRIYWQIRLRAEPARLLISKIAPYVPQCMDYKLKVRPARELRNCVVCGIEIEGERRMHSDLVSCRKPACRKEHKRRTNARYYRKVKASKEIPA